MCPAASQQRGKLKGDSQSWGLEMAGQIGGTLGRAQKYRMIDRDLRTPWLG
jgi:hypothetical protein